MTEEIETNYKYLNKKRINSTNEWIKILNSTNENDQKAIDVLLYLYDCKDYTSNGKEIAKFFNTEIGAINVYIKSFGAKIIKEFNIEEQIYGDGHRRRWNLFFE